MSDIVWRPTEEFRRQTNYAALINHCGLASYEELAARADADPEWFWRELARWLGFRFIKEPARMLDITERGLPFPRWCPGGTTNLAMNILDKRSPAELARTAVIWEGESGEVRECDYAWMAAETARFAAALTGLGLGKGDVVAVFMPMQAELMAAFLGCMKVGCIVQPLFSGFGPEAIAQRLHLAGPKAIIATDTFSRRGELLPMKATLDAALGSVAGIRHVIVVRNGKGDAPMRAGRDLWWPELRSSQPDTFPSAELDAEHPALVIYTSGTTGLPKGAVHTHCGLGIKCGQDLMVTMDIKATDRVLWPTDFGWFGGVMQLCGILMAGATSVIAEGAPTHPDPGRLWRLAERFRISHLGMAPTLARSLRAVAGAALERYDLSSLRIMCSTGELWDTESWTWAFEKIGGSRVPIVNFSGGTEMGSMISSNILYPQKPVSFNGPVIGTGSDIVDGEGRSVAPGQIGDLVMRQACIGTTRGLWKDEQRYLESYWRQHPGMWTQGDLASRDADGFWFLHGRSDDTIKVSGKRIGPSEFEDILIATKAVAEAAAVSLPDPRKGSQIVCVVVPAAGVAADASLSARLTKAIVDGLGSSFRPERIVFANDLPKTRSMKIMRRVIRATLAGQPAGDLSSLVNPEAVAELKRIAGA